MITALAVSLLQLAQSEREQSVLLSLIQEIADFSPAVIVLL